MKFLTAILIFAATLSFGSPFYYNSFTTNSDSAALAVVTNISVAVVSNQVQASLSEPIIAVSGGLTTNNYTQYSDTNGSSAYWYLQATNFASTNQPSSLVTTSQLAAATNAIWVASVSYSGKAATNAANQVYSNNPSGYLKSSATNGLTFLGSNVVSSIASGGGITVYPYITPIGIQDIISVSGTNNVNITNLTPSSLESYGALTTNKSSWTNYVAPVMDWTNAYIYTNGLLTTSSAAAIYKPLGPYLTASSNLNYLNISNPPSIPSTNGFITSNSLAPYATTAFVTSQGYTNANILTNYTSISSLNAILSGYTLLTTLDSASNALQGQISSNSSAIGACWSTNQPFVGVIVASTNMAVTLKTNAGIITATLSSAGGAVTGFQPASTNLTNWSYIQTNQILITTNVITSIVNSSGTSETFVTNSSGITAYIAASATSLSGWGMVQFKSPGINVATNFSWTPALVAAPTSVKVYNSLGQVFTAPISSSTSSGFTFNDTQGVVTNQAVTVIGIVQ